MAFNQVRFACTSLQGTNKVGQLKPDENGYYPMVVGALNVFNSAGQYYVYDQAKELFQQSSQLMRRVARGALRGECGHPKMLPGMTKEQYAHRILSIYEENVCCHHKEISLDFDNVKDEKGKPIIAIISKVCPSGPMGSALERSLKNKDENVCFSIRAFTDDYRDRGVYKRVLKTIVTFDQVNEPGISFAEKFRAPALEELDEMTLSRGELERGVSTKGPDNYATESILLTANELFASMGWAASAEVSNRPNWAKW
jgi:hypothetical protein